MSADDVKAQHVVTTPMGLSMASIHVNSTGSWELLTNPSEVTQAQTLRDGAMLESFIFFSFLTF